MISFPAAKLVTADDTSNNYGKKIAVFVVTYNAVTTLKTVLQRIPASVYESVESIVVFDDASPDATYELAIGLKNTIFNRKLDVVKHPVNLGYGGNQKSGYSYLIEQGFDAVVLLHGDGQYAPEFLAQMYHPIVAGKADAVFGSRMMKTFGGPLRGGMPLYKYVGNRILSILANTVIGLNLTEWHSGYRAYNLHALKAIDFSGMTNDFHFDTEIIIKLHHQGFRIVERAIPTYYGEEICHVNGIKYARNVARSLYRYKKTLSSGSIFPEYKEYYVHYPIKSSKNSSHEIFLRLAGTGRELLDLGCGEGFMAEHLIRAGNNVTGVDELENPCHKALFKEYYQGSLDQGLLGLGTKLQSQKFDQILLMDILEHLTKPEALLQDLHQLCQPNTQIIISVPNVANITVRFALLFGCFNYTARGILDRTHLKFWTRSSIQRLTEQNQLEVTQTVMTVMPLELVLGLSPKNLLVLASNRLLGAVTWLFPALFGYQTIIIARSKKPGRVGN